MGSHGCAGGGDYLSIEHKSYARVGLLGNPSDVYFGRTISFSVGNFWAWVRLDPSKDFVIEPHPHHDLLRFDSAHRVVAAELAALTQRPEKAKAKK